MPVPPPTLPSSTGPAFAPSIAASTCAAFTWNPLTSFSSPSQVSATTGVDHQYPEASGSPFFTRHAIVASCTVPTLWVLVSITGPSSRPDSSIHERPVISPAPFNTKLPAKAGVVMVSRPRGRMAVTPVRTLRPSARSSISVTCPTVTPATSVIALSGPGLPSNGTPRSRARGPARAADAARAAENVRMLRSTRNPVTNCCNLAGILAGIETWGRHATSIYDGESWGDPRNENDSHDDPCTRRNRVRGRPFARERANGRRAGRAHARRRAGRIPRGPRDPYRGWARRIDHALDRGLADRRTPDRLVGVHRAAGPHRPAHAPRRRHQLRGRRCAALELRGSRCADGRGARARDARCRLHHGARRRNLPRVRRRRAQERDQRGPGRGPAHVRRGRLRDGSGRRRRGHGPARGNARAG